MFYVLNPCRKTLDDVGCPEEDWDLSSDDQAENENTLGVLQYLNLRTSKRGDLVPFRDQQELHN